MLTAGRRALVALVLFSLAVAASASSVHAHSSSSTPGQTVSQAARTRAAQLTNDLIYLNAQYQLAGSRQKAQLEADLVAAAVARKQELLALVDSDPSAMLGLVLTSNLRSSLPASVSQHIEEEVDIEGVLEILHEDRYDGSRYHYGLQTASGRLSLHFADDPPTHLLTGARIRAHGFRLDGTLALGSGRKNVQTVAAAPLQNTLGAQKTLVILVDFSDNPTQPYTAEYAQSVVFGTTNDFFLENSFQQTWLTGTVVGWYTIALSSPGCDTATLAAQAEAEATAAGIDVAGYPRRVYAFPKSAACGWAGLSTVGGNPSRAWINGGPGVRTVAHELGHGLGLWHSHALDCGTVVLGDSCKIIEYGDVVDTMGGPIGYGPPAHFNAFQKERLGWLNSGSSPPITTVLTGGTYTLDAYELVGSTSKALKVLRSTDPSTGQRTWYYLESRQAIGFDAFLAQEVTNILNGVLIHSGSESNGNTSQLINLSPTTYSWWDPALVAGESFSDPEAGLTITTEWVTATGAAVTIRFDEALSVSTDQPIYNPGQSVSISGKVTRGGSPVANAAVSFTVTKANGSVVTGTGTTGSNGIAVYKLRLSKHDPSGVYQASAAASNLGTASTTFAVQ